MLSLFFQYTEGLKIYTPFFNAFQKQHKFKYTFIWVAHKTSYRQGKTILWHPVDLHLCLQPAMSNMS